MSPSRAYYENKGRPGCTCMRCGAPTPATGRKYCDTHNPFAKREVRDAVEYVLEDNKRLRARLAELEGAGQ